MLIKVRKLVVTHENYGRNVHLKEMYVNTRSIISVSDYDGATSFLLSEESPYSDKSFSLVKIQNGQETEELVVIGTAESIFKDANSGKKLLNG